MQFTKSALSMLLKRYIAVLKKCHLRDISLILASSIIFLGLSVREIHADEFNVPAGENVVISSQFIGIANAKIDEGASVTINPDVNVSLNWSDIQNDGNVKIDGNFHFYNESTIVNNGNIDVNSKAWVTADESSLQNNGYIRIDGGVDLTANQRDNIEIENNGTVHIASTYAEGQNTASYYGGLRLLNMDQFNSIRKGKLIIGYLEDVDGMMGSMLRLSSDEPVSLNTSDFIAGNTPQNGKILMANEGVLYFSRTLVQLIGDSLALGSYTFGQTQTTTNGTSLPRYASLCTDFLDLVPQSGNTFTLEKGRILINGVSQNPHINVADGKGVLHINGGRVNLGQTTSGTHGGRVAGDILIGSDTLKDHNERYADNNGMMHEYDSFLDIGSGDWTVTGDVTLEKTGRLRVGGSRDIHNKDNILTANLFINGALTLNGDNFYTDSLATLKAGSIIGNEKIALNIGDEYTPGLLMAGNMQMKGGQINFDPPFIADGDTSNASMGGLQFASDNMDARINVGRNSMVTLGSSDPEWLRTRISEYQEKNSLLWGRDITAALAVRAPQTLSPLGGLNVDGSWTTGGVAAAVNTARFADKSLFVVDAASIKDQTALDGNGTAALNVERGARLLITDAALGDEIRVTGNFASNEVDDDGWTANASTSTDLLYVEGQMVNGEYRAKVTDGTPINETFPALSSGLANVVDNARATGLDTDSSCGGRRLVSRAVDNRYIGSTDRNLAAATMESAARIAVLGAVPQMAKAANDAAGAAITQRTGLANPGEIIMAVDASGNQILEAQKRFARQFALWIMPLYQSTNGFGMEADNFNYGFSGALGGVALGADYTFENMLRIGVAFNIGGGYASGAGDLNKTTNNMNFWGLGAYAGFSQNNFGLTADMNYTSTYNKLKQELPSQMRMTDLKGDVQAWALSAGLRAEYKIETAYVDLTPHAGFRFTSLNMDSHTIRSNGNTVLDGDAISRNIWTFPIGVSFSKQYAMANNWHVKPLLDLNVTPAAGDFNARSKIRFSGIAQEADLDTQMFDYITYGGTAGIELGNDTISLGVNYNGQFGTESSAHGVFGTFRYEF